MTTGETVPNRTLRRIILFKTPTPNPCGTALPDPYSHLCKTLGRFDEVYFVPVLEETFVNEQSLRSVIRDGVKRSMDVGRAVVPGYDAVVATSQRAGLAWLRAARAVQQESISHGQPVGSGKGKGKATVEGAGAHGERESARRYSRSWSTVPLFTPGPSTSASFRPSQLERELIVAESSAEQAVGQANSSELPQGSDLPDPVDITPFVPTEFPGANETGSGSALAKLMVTQRREWLPPENDQGDVQVRRTGRVLVLTGDKNSPELSTILREGGLQVSELEVYRTGPRSALGADLKRLFDSLDMADDDDDNDSASVPASPIWLAFFSPSSARAVLGTLTEALGIDRFDTPDFRLAAIGQTTQDWLEDKEGWEVDAVAGKPTAGALMEAILEAEAREKARGGPSIRECSRGEWGRS